MEEGIVTRVVENPNRSICDFDLIKVIGTGTFGKVYLAKLGDDDGKLYAVKEIRKDRLLENEKVLASTELEKNIMLEFDHPFLVTMEYLFQDD